MVLFDSQFLLLFLDPQLPAPTGVAEVGKRIKQLINELQENREKIVVPTPVLAEVLVRSGRASGDYLTKLEKSAAFVFEPFGVRAAVEHGRMTASAVQSGDKFDKSPETWAKVKFDRQIVAIATVLKVSVIYTHDDNLAKFAEKQGIKVVRLTDLPIPEKEPQMKLWESEDEEDD